MIVGIVKKALIADYIAQYNDLIFNNPELYTGVQTLMGVVGYTMQIYCDFSGYSDMAIGIALILGFRLGLNFDSPYQSRNLTEFGDDGTSLFPPGFGTMFTFRWEGIERVRYPARMSTIS